MDDPWVASVGPFSFIFINALALRFSSSPRWTGRPTGATWGTVYFPDLAPGAGQSLLASCHADLGRRDRRACPGMGRRPGGACRRQDQRARGAASGAAARPWRAPLVMLGRVLRGDAGPDARSSTRAFRRSCPRRVSRLQSPRRATSSSRSPRWASTTSPFRLPAPPCTGGFLREPPPPDGDRAGPERRRLDHCALAGHRWTRAARWSGRIVGTAIFARAARCSG